MGRVIRNQRIPYEEQLAELETVAKVQMQLRDEFRNQLTLPRLVASPLQSPQDLDFNISSDDSDWNSAGASPTKRSRRDSSFSPGSGSHGGLSSDLGRGSDSDMDTIGDMDPSLHSDSYYDGSSTPPLSSSYDGFSPSRSFLANGQIASSSSASMNSARSGDQNAPIARQLWKSSARTENSAARSLARGEDSELGDLNRLLSADMKMQDDITEDLVKYASAMKESALHANLKIRSDAKQLDKMVDRMDANSSMTTNASQNVNQLLNTSSSSTWGYWTMLCSVFLAFVVVWFFMKLVPKPRT